MKFKAAAVHAAPVFMDKNATVEKACNFIKEAGGAGIELLVFPETFIPGYPYWIECYPPLDQGAALSEYIDQSVEISGPEIERLRHVARQHGVAVVMGISERLEGTKTLFNSQAFIDKDGTLLGVHRKLQPTYVERIVWAQGSGKTLSVYSSTLGRLGGLACWEHTMNLARQALIMDGIQIHAAAWPGLSTMAGFEAVADIQIDAMMKTHALTGQCFVISAGNPVDRTCLDWMERKLGPQSHVKEGGGWSAVIHPFCSYLAEPHTGSEQKLVVGEIDLDQLNFVKVWLDTAGHYSRPELLRLNVNRQGMWHDEKNGRETGFHSFAVGESEEATATAIGQ
ncbi:carbon-nitrogen hydrolase family protein [Variovorax sp. LjRoot84]|uniref:carbon-nitrogen hydrolase family protein n=1 Tax=Variovorax sp. LjRoot84 TaxID=3342340 RepID=UPI003ECDEF39